MISFSKTLKKTKKTKNSPSEKKDSDGERGAGESAPPHSTFVDSPPRRLRVRQLKSHLPPMELANPPQLKSPSPTQ